MQVRVSPVSVFVILEVDAERVLVQAVGDGPGRYPFTYRVDDLIAAPG